MTWTKQWRSLVRRAQEKHGREDVGQDSVAFSSFRMASICDELSGTYPELAAAASASGYERFCPYWRRSDEEQARWADVSVFLGALRNDLRSALEQIGSCVGIEFDLPVAKAILSGHPSPPAPLAVRWLRSGVHRLGRRYARSHVKVRGAFHRARGG